MISGNINASVLKQYKSDISSMKNLVSRINNFNPAQKQQFLDLGSYLVSALPNASDHGFIRITTEGVLQALESISSNHSFTTKDAELIISLCTHERTLAHTLSETLQLLNIAPLNQKTLTDISVSLSNNNVPEDRNIAQFLILCANRDLSNLNLNDQNFSNLDLRGVNFSNSFCRRADFSYSNCEGINFYRAFLTQANVNGVTSFKQADFRALDLTGINSDHYYDIDSNVINLSNLNLSETNFSALDLTKAQFVDSKIEGANFSQSNLFMANFSATAKPQETVSFNQVNFSDATLTLSYYNNGLPRLKRSSDLDYNFSNFNQATLNQNSRIIDIEELANINLDMNDQGDVDDLYRVARYCFNNKMGDSTFRTIDSINSKILKLNLMQSAISFINKFNLCNKHIIQDLIEIFLLGDTAYAANPVILIFIKEKILPYLASHEQIYENIIRRLENFINDKNINFKEKIKFAADHKFYLSLAATDDKKYFAVNIKLREGPNKIAKIYKMQNTN